ncbi:hypothetical protein L4D76_24165 [Photobacterium sagamiensis]|uniref:hypothetical protein n=1 Tax=Photobacterium sagamiensis TaxID=2910241 RepID=UPI003D0F5B24
MLILPNRTRVQRRRALAVCHCRHHRGHRVALLTRGTTRCCEKNSGEEWFYDEIDAGGTKVVTAYKHEKYSRRFGSVVTFKRYDFESNEL